MYSFLSNSFLVLNTHLILFARTKNISLCREKNLWLSTAGFLHFIMSSLPSAMMKVKPLCIWMPGFLRQDSTLGYFPLPWQASHLGPPEAVLLGSSGARCAKKWSIESQPWPVSVFSVWHLVVVWNGLHSVLLLMIFHWEMRSVR